MAAVTLWMSANRLATLLGGLILLSLNCLSAVCCASSTGDCGQKRAGKNGNYSFTQCES